MRKDFYLITGTSRGIGEALAQQLLKNGHTVLGVSRNQSELLKSKNYYHLQFDLSQTSEIERIVEMAKKITDNQGFDFYCLINNAALLEPLKSIENCIPAEIEAHMRIGLLAPMILTSGFIKYFSGFSVRKKIVFISSGAGFNAFPDTSNYCSSKAAINMFAQCVGLEQNNRNYGFEVIAVSPGMVETSMQKIARSKSNDEFAMAGYFKQSYENGKVKDRMNAVEKIIKVINNKYEQGKFVNAADM